MLTLPPDYWVTPQRGEVPGAIIAAAIWFYFFFARYRRAMKSRDMLMFLGLMTVLFALVMAGGVIGGLIGLELGPRH